MGFLDKITKAFTGEDTLSEENGVWNIISTNEELEAILLASNERTQVVFKHSPSCGVSYFALRHLNDPQLFENNEIDFAMRVGVRHESPQIFVVKDGEVKWHASHNSVNAKNVLEHI